MGALRAILAERITIRKRAPMRNTTESAGLTRNEAENLKKLIKIVSQGGPEDSTLMAAIVLTLMSKEKRYGESCTEGRELMKVCMDKIKGTSWESIFFPTRETLEGQRRLKSAMDKLDLGVE